MWKTLSYNKLYKNKLLFSSKNHLVSYPTSININYNWSFGLISWIFVLIQFITGFLLASHYVSTISIAFENIEHIMRNVEYGWLIRYMHSNSASFFFTATYCHIFRSVYYKSFLAPRHWLWISGVLILIVSILVSFIGYVLPWGQMSYWGATVITNLITMIPNFGGKLVTIVWGGFIIENPTLIRFFNFHYISAIMLLILILVHLILLHEVGSSNPIGIKNFSDKSKFHKFFTFKDLFSLLIIILIFFFIVFFYPNLLNHSDNYIRANSFVTSTHIVPEWYFLPFYAIPRSIDDKTIGVLAMLSSITILIFLIWCDEGVKDTRYIHTVSNLFFWPSLIIVVLLWFIGGLPAESPYIYFGKILTISYFLIFFIYFVVCLNSLKFLGIFKLISNNYKKFLIEKFTYVKFSLKNIKSRMQSNMALNKTLIMNASFWFYITKIFPLILKYVYASTFEAYLFKLLFSYVALYVTYMLGIQVVIFGQDIGSIQPPKPPTALERQIDHYLDNPIQFEVGPDIRRNHPTGGYVISESDGIISTGNGWFYISPEKQLQIDHMEEMRRLETMLSVFHPDARQDVVDMIQDSKNNFQKNLHELEAQMNAEPKVPTYRVGNHLVVQERFAEFEQTHPIEVVAERQRLIELREATRAEADRLAAQQAAQQYAEQVAQASRTKTSKIIVFSVALVSVLFAFGGALIEAWVSQ